MSALSIETRFCHEWVSSEALEKLSGELQRAHTLIRDKTGAGNDFLGWVDLPADYPADQLALIKECAARIKKQAQVLVVIGIGGSHLGGEAGLQFCRGQNYNALATDTPEIYFVGHNLSASAWQEVARIIGQRDFAINVISKSGTTLEPALCFGYFQDLAQKKYGTTAAEHIYVTTDKASGLMKQQADERGWTTLVVPDDIGGRYSAFSPVGALVWEVAGISLDTVLAGANQARQDLADMSLANPTWVYAGTRFLLGQQGKVMELYASYEPRLSLLGRWWQQLFGESEGKDGRGLYPATIDLTQDLHSLGQYIQQGQRLMLETTLALEQPVADQTIVLDPLAAAKWPYLHDQTISFVNDHAMRATIAAHAAGGVPNILLTLARADEWHLGYIMYFFELACALSAYLLGVNPFDQPGVNAYKDRMMQSLAG
ncbi:glucose-6-phosphate isomerase [bacterium]|nr:glucose-6-phosphate isomerase [bacterium]